MLFQTYIIILCFSFLFFFLWDLFHKKYTSEFPSKFYVDLVYFQYNVLQ